MFAGSILWFLSFEGLKISKKPFWGTTIFQGFWGEWNKKKGGFKGGFYF